MNAAQARKIFYIVPEEFNPLHGRTLPFPLPVDTPCPSIMQYSHPVSYPTTAAEHPSRAAIQAKEASHARMTCADDAGANGRLSPVPVSCYNAPTLF